MNGHSNIDTIEATAHLKNILNVGKPDCSDGEIINPTKMESASSVESSFKNEGRFQKIELARQEENIPIYGTDVNIYSSPLVDVTESRKIFIDNIVDYGWEQKCHLGCLVSVHLSKKYLAYALKAIPSPYGFVRVIKHPTNNHLLLRGFKGGAKDVAFAHSMTRILLGCVDETGELFVYQLFDSDKGLSEQLCIHVLRPANTPSSIYHRLVWCPYVPEDGSCIENNDLAQDDVTSMMTSLLVVTHNEKAEIWNIDIVMKEYGSKDVNVEKVKAGMQLICEHKEPITAAAFSPDAIALATSSLDGEVKFFQVNIQESDMQPKCLHKWTPHFGKPLSSLFFLDNHRSYSSEVQFWKYALTGADNNQELKVWSCKTWQCLQTIRIFSNDSDGISPCLKAEIDLSANYLVLSDVNRKVLYIMKIRQESGAMISSISEYVVQYPVLSFSVVDISPFHRKFPLNSKNSDNEDEEDDEDDKDDEYDDNDSIGRKSLSFYLRLFWIHTKSFQQCRIQFYPTADSPTQSVGSVSSSQDSFVYKDGLSDLSSDIHEHLVGDHVDLLRKTQSEHKVSPTKAVQTGVPSAPLPTSACLPPAYQDCKEVLLTPKDFTSTPVDLPSVNIVDSYNILELNNSKDLADEEAEIIEQGDMSALDTDRTQRPRRKSSQHSGTSSPSREVAEILSPNQILDCEGAGSSPEKKDIELPNLPMEELADHSPVLSMRKSEYSQNEWPQAPDPNKEYKVIPRNEEEMHLPHPSLEQNAVRHNIQNFTDGDMSPDDILNTKSMFERLEQSIEALSQKVTSINDVLQHQNQSIQFVQSEIHGLQEHQKYIQNNFETVDTMESSISSKIEQILTESFASEFARVETLLKDRDSEDVQRFEQQSITLSQNIATNISTRLDKIVKQEIKNTFVPQTNKSMEALILQMQVQLLQKLNITDNALKENINKHLKSKAFSDNLASTAVGLLQQSMQVACKDVFQNNMLPSLNKFFSNLFAQLNNMFAKGSSELIEKQMQHAKLMNSTLDCAIKSHGDRINKVMSDAEQAMEKINIQHAEQMKLSSESDRLIAMVRQAVQDEVRKSLNEQNSVVAIRSRQATPAPSDPQINPQYLVQLAKQGHMNEAFQQALSAVDVKLVLFLCENVSVDVVFESVPCPLAQHVLLSLISQLSGDLNHKTEVKVRYIEDAIASLNSASLTKNHIEKVIVSLRQRVSAYVSLNPNSKYLRDCRRILRAVDAFLK